MSVESVERREGQERRELTSIEMKCESGGRPQRVSTPSHWLIINLVDALYVRRARCSGLSSVICHICSVTRRNLLYSYKTSFTIKLLSIVYTIMSPSYFPSVRCILYMFQMRARRGILTPPRALETWHA
jgi:hypothetical protein